MYAAPRECPLPGHLALAAATAMLFGNMSAASAACLHSAPDLSILSEDETRAAVAGSLLELTNTTLAVRLEAAASAQHYTVFTTTSAWQPELINMTRNWFAHIKRCAV